MAHKIVYVNEHINANNRFDFAMTYVDEYARASCLPACIPGIKQWTDATTLIIPKIRHIRKIGRRRDLSPLISVPLKL